ncbi:MAG: response regulator transcription factor, partial [Mesorhizobium sp.]
MVATILVADDHPLLLHGLTSLIARDPGFRIVGSAQNGTAAMAMIRQEKPDVAVLDLSMPGMS